MKANIHAVFVNFEKLGRGLKIRWGSPLVGVQLPLPAPAFSVAALWTATRHRLAQNLRLLRAARRASGLAVQVSW